MGYLVFVSLIPLIGVNIWHSILLATRNKKHSTISEQATTSKEILLTHQLVHIFASCVLLVFAVLYLVPTGLIVPAIFITHAALFDILEVLTLHTHSNKPSIKHTIAAWTMASSYLVYATVLSAILQQPYITASIWVLLAALMIGSALYKFKNFWITQHIYFCFIALIIAYTHIQLLF